MPPRAASPGEGNIKLTRFKGLNLEPFPTEIGDNELQTATNVKFDKQGLLVARTGWKQYTLAEIGNSTDFETKFIGSLTRLRTNVDILVYKDGHLLTGDGVHGFVDRGILYNDRGRMPGVQYKDKFYLGSGQSWDGTTLATVDHMPSGRINAMAVHDNRVFFCEVTDTGAAESLGNRMHFSEAGDPDAHWPDLNAIDVAPGDGYVVQLLSYKNNLYVFKTTGIWVLLTGPDPANWILRKVTGEVKCVGQTAQVSGGIVYFVGQDGVYTFNGTSLQRLSDPIAPIFRGLIEFDTTEQAVIWQDQYIFWVISGGVRRMFVYNIKWRAWSEWVVSSGSTWTEPHSLALNPAPPYGHNQDLVAVFSVPGDFNSRLRKMDDTDTFYEDGGYFTTTRGTGYAVSVKTKRWDFGEPLKLKRNRWSSVEIRGKNITTTATGSKITRTASIGNSDLAKPREYKMPGVGYTRYLEYEIDMANTKDNRFELHNLEVAVEVRQRFAESTRT